MVITQRCAETACCFCCCCCCWLQDELLSTELLFRGLLTGMAPEEAVALMSALVFQVSKSIHTHTQPRSHPLLLLAPRG
jgi:superfamily II RNA helicase